METKVKIATYILVVIIAYLCACKTEVGDKRHLFGYWQYELHKMIPEPWIRYDYDTVGLGFSHDSILVNPLMDFSAGYDIVRGDILKIIFNENNLAEYVFTFAHKDSLQLISLDGPSFLFGHDTIQLSRMAPVHNLQFKYLSFSSWFDDFGFPVLDARLDLSGNVYLKRYINPTQYTTECAAIDAEELRYLQKLIQHVNFHIEMEYEPVLESHDWYTSLVIQFENDESASVYGGSSDTRHYHFVIGRIRRILSQSENVPCDHEVVFPSRALLDPLLR